MALTLSPAGGEDYRHIKPLFLSAFPPEERPPFLLWKHKAKRGKGRILAAWDGGKFVGFVSILEHLDMGYLFYLAIHPALRGQGYGTQVLSLLQEEYRGKRLFLAREQLDETADNYPLRLRRHQFYLRCGFRDWPIFIQEGKVVYDVMGLGSRPITAQEYDALMTRWAGRLMRRVVKMRLLEQPPQAADHPKP